jgi:hypothetical protein
LACFLKSLKAFTCSIGDSTKVCKDGQLCAKCIGLAQMEQQSPWNVLAATFLLREHQPSLREHLSSSSALCLPSPHRCLLSWGYGQIYPDNSINPTVVSYRTTNLKSSRSYYSWIGQSLVEELHESPLLISMWRALYQHLIKPLPTF